MDYKLSDFARDRQEMLHTESVLRCDYPPDPSKLDRVDFHALASGWQRASKKLAEPLSNLLQVSRNRKMPYLMTFESSNFASCLLEMLSRPNQYRDAALNLIINFAATIDTRYIFILLTEGLLECLTSVFNSSLSTKETEQVMHIWQNICYINQQIRNDVIDKIDFQKIRWALENHNIDPLYAIRLFASMLSFPNMKESHQNLFLPVIEYMVENYLESEYILEVLDLFAWSLDHEVIYKEITTTEKKWPNAIFADLLDPRRKVTHEKILTRALSLCRRVLIPDGYFWDEISANCSRIVELLGNESDEVAGKAARLVRYIIYYEPTIIDESTYDNIARLLMDRLHDRANADKDSLICCLIELVPLCTIETVSNLVDYDMLTVFKDAMYLADAREKLIWRILVFFINFLYTHFSDGIGAHAQSIILDDDGESEIAELVEGELSERITLAGRELLETLQQEFPEAS